MYFNFLNQNIGFLDSERSEDIECTINILLRINIQAFQTGFVDYVKICILKIITPLNTCDIAYTTVYKKI